MAEAKFCGNCGEPLEHLGDNHYYCKKDNVTITINEGKQTVAKPKGGLLEQVKELLKKHEDRIAELEKSQAADDSLCGF